VVTGGGNEHVGLLPKFRLSELKDNPAKNEPGWYFICDKRNRMQEQKRWLLNRVLQTSELTDQFIYVETGEWRQRRVNDYLDKLSHFLEKLLILIHITSGQPARSQELLSVRYCNTEKGGHRSIFVENGLLVIVTYYHKGYNITGTEKIIHRYLPLEVGEIVLWYIWLVLPMRQQLQQLALNNDEIPSAFLWSVDGRSNSKKWTGESFRKVLKRESDQLIGVPLNKKSYRHIAIAISDRYMKRAKFDLEKEKDERQDKNEDEQHDEVVARQSGHTVETAGATYARLLEEAPSHVQQMRYRFRTSSIEWHEVLQFSRQLEGNDLEKDSGSRLGGDLKRGWGEEHERSPGPRFRRWQALRQTDLQSALQQLMGQDTQFRGKQQTALRAIMDNKSPIILVMATGAGKSLVFMLPASVKDAGTTVVVTPLIALKQDMQRRCRQLGIDCIAWSARKKIQDTSILLVTPESAVSQGFMNHLRKLQGMDRLDRIVIDECHVLLNTQLDFRRKLQKLKKLVEFTVQLVLLTATLPPSKESELLSMISIEAPLMFRDMTSRHNIAYTVQQCKAKDIDQTVMNIVLDRLQQYATAAEGRVIVYGGQIEHCKTLAEKLNCTAYFAKAEDKTEALQDWLNGKTQVVVATNALGLGINVSNVRLVLHAEPSFDLLNYGQESGRAGRDRARSEAIVIVAEDRIPRKFKNTDERLLWEYLTTKECRRIKLDQYLDGNLTTEFCAEDQEACDNCKQSQRQSLPPEVEEEENIYRVVEEEESGK
jgi:superfamily II DNA or RNA helicase